MGQPVKLSETLMTDARVASHSFKRSIASQIEYWATIGRAMDPLLTGKQAAAICGKMRAPLSEIFATVDSPAGVARLKAHLKSRPFPQYEATRHAGVFVRIDKDGKRTKGRVVGKTFEPLDAKNAALV